VDDELPALTEEELGDVERLYCFLDGARVCGGSCMAFITFPREAKSSELSGVQKSCALLQSFERTGRNLTVLAQTVVQQDKRQHVAAQDALRAEHATTCPLWPLCRAHVAFP